MFSFPPRFIYNTERFQTRSSLATKINSFQYLRNKNNFSISTCRMAEGRIYREKTEVPAPNLLPSYFPPTLLYTGLSITAWDELGICTHFSSSATAWTGPCSSLTCVTRSLSQPSLLLPILLQPYEQVWHPEMQPAASVCPSQELHPAKPPLEA